MKINDQMKMALWIITILLAAVLGGVTSQAQLPVRVSSVNSSEAGACKSPPPLSKQEEIQTAIRSNINPYLTKRYGPLHNCGGPGWTQVVSVNMSDSNSTCPTGYTLRTSPVRSCGRSGDTKKTAANFIVGQPYSHVCGRVIAIQKGSTNGFGPQFFDTDVSHYVDGVTLRHGSQYNRGHIWTFVSASSENPAEKRTGCPCSYDSWNYQLPSFLGSNYFCDTGNEGAESNSKTFLGDPLWDGKGCPSTSNCCQFNNPPWFYRELPQPTSNSLKLTIVINAGASQENVFIQEIELYVSL